MKRSKFGLGLLLALLALGVLSTWVMCRWMPPMAEAVRQAGEAALGEDWETAEEIASQVEDQWEKRFPLFASLSDHEPMENINGLFAQLEVFGGRRDGEGFAAICAQLAENLEAMGEAHSLKWWNIL